MATSMLHVRLDDDLKIKATEALAAMGISASDAVRMLFHRIVAEQAFPLELKVPNAETRAAMEEARQIMEDIKAGRAQPRFKNAEEMLTSIERGE
jgi:DNA-damage-inducible protein J